MRSYGERSGIKDQPVGQGFRKLRGNYSEQLEGLEDASYRELRLMEEMESTPEVTQRHLANRLGIALGVANLLLRNLAKRGYIQATRLGWKRWVYVITPAGFTRKVQLTLAYVNRFMDHYQRVRAMLRQELGALTLNVESRIAIYGTTELTELVYLALRDMGVTEIDVFDRESRRVFLGTPVKGLESMDAKDHDTVIMAFSKDVESRREELYARGVPDSQIVALLSNSNHGRGASDLEEER